MADEWASATLIGGGERGVADGCRWLQIKRGICNLGNTLRDSGLDGNFRVGLQSGR